jgi:hypothetical protein
MASAAFAGRFARQLTSQTFRSAAPQMRLRAPVASRTFAASAKGMHGLKELEAWPRLTQSYSMGEEVHRGPRMDRAFR